MRGKNLLAALALGATLLMPTSATADDPVPPWPCQPVLNDLIQQHDQLLATQGQLAQSQADVARARAEIARDDRILNRMSLRIARLQARIRQMRSSLHG